MFREKINKYVLEAANNEECIQALEDFIESCGSYVLRVNNFEAALITRRISMEGNKYVQYMRDLENYRSKAHNMLIANIQILDRICRINNIEVPIKCNLDNTVEVQNMAISLIDELYSSRKH